MGMYDSVFADCKCGKVIEFQSKARPDAYLATYYHTGVPVEIANDLDGRTQSCPVCGARVTLRSGFPKAVPMTVEFDSEAQET